ncbi:hypothetical protein [Streptomyces sp. MN13]
MAPEALCGTFDCRTDMYSLGCVLYEMVTAQRPSTGTSWYLVNQRLNEQPAPLCTLRPDAPAELQRFASRLMAKDPAQRARHGGRPPVITDDMLHIVLRRRANGEGSPSFRGSARPGRLLRQAACPGEDDGSDTTPCPPCPRLM